MRRHSSRRPTFPSTCLSPEQPGYGQVVNSPTGRRRARRNVLASSLAPGKPLASGSRHAGTSRQQEQAQSGLSMFPATPEAPKHIPQKLVPISPALSQATASTLPPAYPHPHLAGYDGHNSPFPYHEPPARLQPTPLTIPAFPQSAYTYPTSADTISAAVSPCASHVSVNDYQAHDLPARERGGSSRSRYTPYGPTPRTSSMRSPSIDLPPLSAPPEQRSQALGPWRQRPRSSSTSMHPPIFLPPIQSLPRDSSRPYSAAGRTFGSAHSLPPISALYEQHLAASSSDSAAVLRRLTLDDETLGLARARRGEEDDDESEPVKPTQEQLWTRRRSLSAPPLHQCVS